jgi:hypothetical protein
MWIAFSGVREKCQEESMSDLSRNWLFTRRGFMRRAIENATVAGAGLVAAGRTGSAAESKGVNPWAYDDSAYRKTDPQLIHYHETHRFQTPYPSPRSIDITVGGELIIAAGKHISWHKSDGTLVSEFALGDEARCLAVTEEGMIFAGLRDHVEVFERKGSRLATWEAPAKNAYFTGLVVAGADVLVADAGGRVVLRYNRLGKLKTRIGERKKDQTTGFIVPSPFFDVAIAPDGLLRVTNPGRHRVEAYTFDGDLEYSWGVAGAAIENFCGCCNPINLAVLKDGYVVTFEKGIPRVKVYSPEGKFRSVVAGPEAFPENRKVCGPNDCTLGGLDGVVDSKGRIYILDVVAGNVRVMERNREPG